MATAPAMDEELDRLADLESRENGYAAFLNHVVVNAQPRPAYWQDVALPWQRDREGRRTGAIDAIAGFREGYAGKRWFWSGYAKGHDKTPGVGRRLLFLLAYSRHPLQLVACAGDQDQAGLITLAMKTEVARNPWLADKVSVSAYGATGESGSTLSVLPLDAWTGQGISPDYIVADEVTHWLHKRGEQFWDFVLATVSKRPFCVFEVLTNAGFLDTWQHRARNWAASSPRWDFYEQPFDTHMATWMDKDAIDEICKGMSPGEVKRVIRNGWIDPGEENGYLTLDECLACVAPRAERTEGTHANNYFLSVDYGGVIDRCALCLLHPCAGGTHVEIDRMDCWQGSHGNPIQIHMDPHNPEARSVQGWIDLTLSRFPNATLVFDPYQMESLAQWYERRGRKVERFEYKAGKRNMRMAQLLKELVQSRQLTWSPEAGLLPGADDDTFAKELSRLIIKPTVYGYRFDHESGRHDDRCLVAETPIQTERGSVKIADVLAGDRVMTRFGYREVLRSWMTRFEETVTVEFDNGSSLTGTVDHPVWTDSGWVGLGFLDESHTVYSWSKPSSARPSLVEVRVLRKSASGVRPVYNLEVDGVHEFFADGILVHNSAAVGMALVYAVPDAKPGGKLHVQLPPKPTVTPAVVPQGHGNWAANRGLFGMR